MTVTPSTRESILQHLHAGLKNLEDLPDLTMSRNVPLGDIEGLFGTLYDGKTEELDTFLNPPRYEFVLRPVILLVVASDTPETGHTAEDAAARDISLDTATEAVSAAFAAITDWPERVMDWRMLPPDFETREVLGAAGMKACEIPIEIEYWSDREQG